MASLHSQGADRLSGYPALANLMGQHGSMALYKQFADLSAHSLLMQQVELLDLQRELDNQQGLGLDEKATASMHSQPPNDGHWQLVLTIRQRLKEYRRYVATSNSSTADPRNEQTKPCYGKPQSRTYQSRTSTIRRSCGTGSAEKKAAITSSPV